MTLPTYQPGVTAAFASDIAKAAVQAHRGKNPGDVTVWTHEPPLTRVDPVRLGDMTIIVDEFLPRADGDNTNTSDSRRTVMRLIAEQGPVRPFKNREQPCPLPGLSATGRIGCAIARQHFSAHRTG